MVCSITQGFRRLVKRDFLVSSETKKFNSKCIPYCSSVMHVRLPFIFDHVMEMPETLRLAFPSAKRRFCAWRTNSCEIQADPFAQSVSTLSFALRRMFDGSFPGRLDLSRGSVRCSSVFHEVWPLSGRPVRGLKIHRPPWIVSLKDLLPHAGPQPHLSCPFQAAAFKLYLIHF